MSLAMSEFKSAVIVTDHNETTIMEDFFREGMEVDEPSEDPLNTTSSDKCSSDLVIDESAGELNSNNESEKNKLANISAVRAFVGTNVLKPKVSVLRVRSRDPKASVAEKSKPSSEVSQFETVFLPRSYLANYGKYISENTDELHAKKQVFQCCNCRLQFKCYQDIQFHLTVHKIKYKLLERVKCDECKPSSPTFENYCSLQLHIKKFHLNEKLDNPIISCENNEREFMCPICKAHFAKECDFFEHCMPYTLFSELLTTCVLCNETLQSVSDYREHCFSIHNLDRDAYLCKICRHPFPRVDAVIKHVNSCHYKEMIFCNTCRRSLTLENYIDEDIHFNSCSTRHSKCGICSSYIVFIGLKQHIMTHRDDVLNYNTLCKHCFNFFINLSVLDKHINESHNPNKPFQEPIQSIAENDELETNLSSSVSKATSDDSKTIVSPQEGSVLGSDGKSTGMIKSPVRKQVRKKSSVKKKVSKSSNKQQVKTVATTTQVPPNPEEKPVSDDGQKDWRCPQCCCIFSMKYGYLNHINNIIHLPKRFKCRICLKMFKTITFITKHIRIMHKEILERQHEESLDRTEELEKKRINEEKNPKRQRRRKSSEAKSNNSEEVIKKKSKTGEISDNSNSDSAIICLTDTVDLSDSKTMKSSPESISLETSSSEDELQIDTSQQICDDMEESASSVDITQQSSKIDSTQHFDSVFHSLVDITDDGDDDTIQEIIITNAKENVTTTGIQTSVASTSSQKQNIEIIEIDVSDGEDNSKTPDSIQKIKNNAPKSISVKGNKNVTGNLDKNLQNQALILQKPTKCYGSKKTDINNSSEQAVVLQNNSNLVKPVRYNVVVMKNGGSKLVEEIGKKKSPAVNNKNVKMVQENSLQIPSTDSTTSKTTDSNNTKIDVAPLTNKVGSHSWEPKRPSKTVLAHDKVTNESTNKTEKHSKKSHHLIEVGSHSWEPKRPSKTVLAHDKVTNESTNKTEKHPQKSHHLTEVGSHSWEPKRPSKTVLAHDKVTNESTNKTEKHPQKSHHLTEVGSHSWEPKRPSKTVLAHDKVTNESTNETEKHPQKSHHLIEKGSSTTSKSNINETSIIQKIDAKNCIDTLSSPNKEKTTDELPATTEIEEIDSKCCNYECEKCDSLFDNNTDKSKHTFVHYQSADITCIQICKRVSCHKKLANYCSYKLHHKVEHERTPLKNPQFMNSNNKTLYKCEVCFAVFINITTFNSHCFPYTNFWQITYDCVECGEIFQKSDAIEEHSKLKHGGKSCLKCKICHLIFDTVFNLKDHVLAKHELIFEKCLKCNLQFETNFLRSHVIKCKI